MNHINWLINKSQTIETASDYKIASFVGTLPYGMIRDLKDFCKSQNARYLDGKYSSGYNMTIEAREGYRKSIAFTADRNNKIDFQVVEEWEA